MKSVNAIIKNADFGYDDHGILDFSIVLEMNGYGVTFGGYALDNYSKELEKRIPSSYGLKWLVAILKTVGVNQWSELKGKPCRAIFESDGVSVSIGDKICGIGNFLDEEKNFTSIDIKKDVKDFRETEVK